MAIGIGMFITVGVLAVGPGYSEGKEATCTLKTLKGRYLFSLHGTLLPPAFGVTEPTPSDAAGFHIFNGDGTGTDIVTFRLGGVTVLENETSSLSYTVNEDCTGSFSAQLLGIFIARRSIATISTAPPGNGVRHCPRVSGK